MTALISVFVAITLSLLITRIATEVLTLTGLSRNSASFQARSAFLVRVPLRRGRRLGLPRTSLSGDPTRQPLVSPDVYEPRPFADAGSHRMWLMFLGNAGIITVISSLVLTFVDTSSAGDGLYRFLYLLLGIALLWIIATNRAFNRILTRLVRKALRRWTDLDLRDYASLLHLKGDYQVMEIEVDSDSWLTHKKLKETRLRDEGVAVLGIQRKDKTYLGAPHGDTYVCPGDTSILYGRKQALMELKLRRLGIAGEHAHQNAIATQQQIEREQSDREMARQGKDINKPEPFRD